ncbi:gas vesicle protein GvpJ [Ammoniphilus sp. YIM 78166]|uniref:gas vesicle protein GvpJ n=1 Tax=Ammoniphilus sp. YIM 78166 TaxID=1644106 RepID=UPI00106F1E13|nr:gas vesicle protein GvpJ [Ammoniphilus sp. YIM 78166]
MVEGHFNEDLTLLDLLDGIIDKGAVLTGELIISIADIDLIIIDLRLLISTIETVMKQYESDQT